MPHQRFQSFDYPLMLSFFCRDHLTPTQALTLHLTALHVHQGSIVRQRASTSPQGHVPQVTTALGVKTPPPQPITHVQSVTTVQ